jgi:hypothetical protein
METSTPTAGRDARNFFDWIHYCEIDCVIHAKEFCGRQAIRYAVTTMIFAAPKSLAPAVAQRPMGP